MEGAGAGDDRHGGEVDAVLDRCELWWYQLRSLSCASSPACVNSRAISACLAVSLPADGLHASDMKEICNTYNKIANEDLRDLCAYTRSPSKQPLQDVDQDVSNRSTDEGTVDGHLRHARREVVAIFIAILCYPRRKQFLKCGERAGCEHLGAERIRLELSEVGLASLPLARV